MNFMGRGEGSGCGTTKSYMLVWKFRTTTFWLAPFLYLVCCFLWEKRSKLYMRWMFVIRSVEFEKGCTILQTIGFTSRDTCRVPLVWTIRKILIVASSSNSPLNYCSAICYSFFASPSSIGRIASDARMQAFVPLIFAHAFCHPQLVIWTGDKLSPVDQLRLKYVLLGLSNTYVQFGIRFR